MVLLLLIIFLCLTILIAQRRQLVAAVKSAFGVKSPLMRILLISVVYVAGLFLLFDEQQLLLPVLFSVVYVLMLLLALFAFGKEQSSLTKMAKFLFYGLAILVAIAVVFIIIGFILLIMSGSAEY